MPQRKSAIKKIRQDKKRRRHNLSIKTDLRKTIKNFNKLISAKKIDDSKTALKKLFSKLDKASAKGLIHKNTAARKKSQFMRALSRIA
ncbi:MAG: 30S ribosomal protein S20 [Bacteroidetes bacterium]|nr:30S ribosomal protein S20 [Bacteroidota bacterium]